MRNPLVSTAWPGLCLVYFTLAMATALSGQQTRLEFNTPGTYTFTVPSDVATLTVQAWGGGGAGGSRTTQPLVTATGGGGGAFAQSTLVVQPGQLYHLKVGDGGRPGIGGGAGAASSFYPPEGAALVLAAPGFGGTSEPDIPLANATLGGRATSCVGQVRYDGGAGSYGGGGGAGTLGPGSPAQDLMGGAGAAWGGGNGASVPVAPSPGQPGQQAGGGGSGATGASGTLLSGGFGAPGRVVILYDPPSVIVSQPVSQSVIYGQDAAFQLTTSLTDPSFQWQEDPGTGYTDIPGATESELILFCPPTSKSGHSYRCIVSDPMQQTTSQEAILTVFPKTLTPLVTIAPKCYDGTTTAEASASLQGVLASDQVTLSWADARYEQADPGLREVTIYSPVLQGNHAANYQLDSYNDIVLNDIPIHALPTATISGPSSFCINQPATLTVELSGQAPWTFEYRFDQEPWVEVGPVTDNTNELPVVPTGSHEVQVRNVADLNCSGNTSSEFLILPGPVTRFNPVSLQDLCDGQTFQAEIMVDHFANVGAVNYTIEYDPAVLVYQDFTLFETAFSGNFQVNCLPDQGIITASGYVAENEPGISLPDGSVLLSLQFSYHHSGDGSTLLEWYFDANNPVHNQYSMAGPLYQPFCSSPHASYFQPGSITGHALPRVGLLINTFPLEGDAVPAVCYDQEVFLSLGQVHSGTAPFSFTWSVNDGSQVIEESAADILASETLFSKIFPAGNYSLNVVSVADAYGCQMPDLSALQADFLVNPEPEIMVTPGMRADTEQEADYITCYNQDFDLAFSGKTGSAPWNITWKVVGPGEYFYSTTTTIDSDGQSTSIPGPFDPGIYTFSVTSLTDGKDCSASLQLLSTYSFSIKVLPEPDPQISVNATSNNGVYEFLFENLVTLSLQDTLQGTPPFSFEWIINGDPNHDLSGSVSDIEIGQNIFSSKLDPGNYEISFTSITDAFGCPVSDLHLANHAIQIRVFPPFSVEGNIYYHHLNIQQQNIDLPLPGVTIQLMKNSQVEYSTISSADGKYSFPNVLPGEYTVGFETSLPAGGINVTDAALANYWSIYPATIEKVQFYSGDVTGFQEPDNLAPDNRLTAGDASMIQDYFQSFSGFNFHRAGWSFWSAHEYVQENPTQADFNIPKPILKVDFGGSSILQDYYALVTGDFNRGHYPSTEKSESEKQVVLIYEEVPLKASGKVEIPVFADMEINLGALSLIFDLSEVQAEVLDVFLMGDSLLPVFFSHSDNQLRVSWYSLQPVKLFPGQVLLSIRLRIDENLPDRPIRISLADDPLNELADESYKIIPGCMIRTLMMVPQKETPAVLTLENHPNPFGEYTNIHYAIPEEGQVVLILHSLEGVVLRILVDQYQGAGNHSFLLKNHGLVQGVYGVSLWFQGDTWSSKVGRLIMFNNPVTR